MDFFARKLNYVWNNLGIITWDGNPEQIVYAPMNHQATDKVDDWYKNMVDIRQPVQPILAALAKIIQTTIYVLSALGFIILLRRFDNLTSSLLALIIIAGIFFYLIWEASARYSLPFIIFLFPVTGYAAANIINKRGVKSRMKLVKF